MFISIKNTPPRKRELKYNTKALKLKHVWDRLYSASDTKINHRNKGESRQCLE